jgi:hypothetical protein
MNKAIWDRFMERLVAEEGKLDEFCNLSDADISQWLLDNNMGVTMDQLAEALPVRALSDEELDSVGGGRAVWVSLQGVVKDNARRFQSGGAV